MLSFVFLIINPEKSVIFTKLYKAAPCDTNLLFSPIPKTSSGKIQCHACKIAFLNGSLNVLEDWSEDPWQKAKFRDLQNNVESLFEKVQFGK